MKTAILLVSIVLLAGCSWICPKPETQYITKNNYVLRQSPTDLFQIPPAIPPLNTTTLTQKDVAEWIAKKNSRELGLEKNILSIQEYYSRPISDAEKADVLKK